MKIGPSFLNSTQKFYSSKSARSEQSAPVEGQSQELDAGVQQQDQDGQPQSGYESDEGGGSKKEPSQEELLAAVGFFQEGLLNQDPGLRTEVCARAPGLRVLLRDERGQVIRQFSASEFLKHSQALGKDFPKSGKILDQKA